MKLRDRIKEFRRVKASDILPNPANWRTHPKSQQDAMRGILAEVGIADALLVRETPTGLQLIDGHLRADVAPDSEWPVLVLDVDDKEAAKLLATVDPLAAMAETDPEKLDSLLRQIDMESEALQQMLAELAAEAGLQDDGVEIIEDEVPAPPDEATTQPGDLWILGDHRLLCGDSSKPEDVDRLLDGAVIHLVNTDPPYNVKVEPRSNNAIAAGLSSFAGPKHHQSLDLARHPEKSKPTGKKLRAKDRPLANDFVSDEAFDQLLAAWFGNIARVLAPGRAFYIWGGYANCANYPPVLQACELYFSQAIIWVKEHPVLTRKDFMGNHEWCQPPDTQVLTPYGAVNIKSLRQDDRVIPYDTNYHDHLGPRRGEHVSVATRHYAGTMHGVVVGDRETHCTDGHIFSVRLHERAASSWCVYLMQRGDWWRVGKCKVAGNWYGFGLKARLKQEQAEAAWILSTHEEQASAMCAEQLVSVKYGIPTTHWEIHGGRSGLRTANQIRSIYEGLNPMALNLNAMQALKDHGRRLDHPIVRGGATKAKMGKRDAFTVRACNLLPGLMRIPVVLPRRRVRYELLRHVDRQLYDGPVYSLDVPISRHYVADGIVTHNCFYGWREGAAHVFLGPNNAVDVWSVKKINPNQMEHLTAKPAELAARAMRYSSRQGENVLDLFGGSGSTLIAAEQLGRRCFMMELDPLYCDVICDRFQRLTGKPAILERTGQSPIPMKPREENMR